MALFGNLQFGYCPFSVPTTGRFHMLVSSSFSLVNYAMNVTGNWPVTTSTVKLDAGIKYFCFLPVNCFSEKVVVASILHMLNEVITTR